MNRFWLSILLLVICSIDISCKHSLERKCLLFFDRSRFDSQVEILNGNVKDVIYGDSLSKELNHPYDRIHFDKQGNMVLLHEIYRDKTWTGNIETVDIKVAYTYEYNKAGQKMALIGNYKFSPDSAGVEKSASKFSLDPKGNITEYKPSYRYNSYQYKYDSIGRVKYKDHWWKKDVPDRYYYKYDANNRLVQINSFEMGWKDKDPATFLDRVTFEYQTFDSHNNWIKKTLHFGLLYPRQIPHTDKNTIYLDRPPYTITRKITYY